MKWHANNGEPNYLKKSNIEDINMLKTALLNCHQWDQFYFEGGIEIVVVRTWITDKKR